MSTNHTLLAPRLLLALSLAAPLVALADTANPPANLADWQCTGQCGSSGVDGDIGLSPLGNAAYGYVTTHGSMAFGTSPLALPANSRGNGTENNGSVFVSSSFQAAAGSQLNVQFNYISTDGKNYDDYGWARLLNASDNSLVAWLFTAQSNNSGSGKIVPGDVVTKAEFDPDDTIVDFDKFSFNTRNASNPVDWSLLGYSNGACWKENAEGCGFTGWLQSSVTIAAAGSYKLEIGVVNWGDSAYDSGLAFDYSGLTPAPLPVPEPGALVLMLSGLAGLGFMAARRRDGGR